MSDARPGDLFQPGDLVNNTYRIEALLGRGGTSDVYRARSEISGRLVAIKVLKSEFSGNDDYLLLLTREEEIREIRHDAVVGYLGNHRTDDGHVYLLMDFVDGPGLDRKLREGPTSAEDILAICRQVLGGLKTAHQRNIVHRDLSPDNIILRNGEPDQAVIIDFGIAKDTNPGAETIVGNEFAGKYAYAAPEQLSGRTDARTDLYSLGALLLAVFRGEKPDVGSNPMEVVQKKGEPLDTDGVPEPLRSLIDRMTAPDPDARFASAQAVLDFMDGEAEAPAARPDLQPTPVEPGDVTIIAPSRSDTNAAPAPERKSRGGLIAIGLAALLAVGLGGGFAAGLFDFGPKYDPVDPYTLDIEKAGDAPMIARGHAPSESVMTSLIELAEQQGGVAEITLASGEIADSWGEDVIALIEILRGLEDWRVAIDGQNVSVTGLTHDEAVHAHVTSTLAEGLPGGLIGRPEIALVPLFLEADVLRPILSQFSDCGPLRLIDAPPEGYGPQTPVVVSGTISSDTGRSGLFDALRVAAEPRRVTLDTEVLNPALCLIEIYLPKAPDSDIAIDFAYGRGAQRGEANETGVFLVGENPVMDVVLPADVTDGFLSVSILDVSGNVFHLLPNINRTEHSVEALRAGQDGEVPVRVTYDIDAAEAGQLAFQVDDSTLGKSKVVVLHSSGAIFEQLRPTTESAGGYAEALRDKARSQDVSIYSLDSRMLVTTAQ